MGLCPRCSWYLPADSVVCPRCGYVLRSAHDVPQLTDQPLTGATPVLSKGEPIANPPGMEFTPPQAMKLRGITPPSTISLSAPSEHGRFRPLKLWGSPKGGSLDPALSESYRFSGVTPEMLKSEVGVVVRPLGFELAEPYKFGSNPDLSIAAKKLSHHEGTEVKGWFYAERGLKVDKVETHRKDRRRWMGIFGGSIPGAVLIFFSLTEPHPWGVLAAPAGLLLGLALVSGLAFADADYWSDVIAVRVLAKLPPSVNGSASKDMPSDYVAQCWVVRAMSEDWETKTASGRRLIAGVDYPGLDAVRATLRSSFSTDQLR